MKRIKSLFCSTDPKTPGYMKLLAKDYYYRLSFAKAEQVRNQVVKGMVQTYGVEYDGAIRS